MDKTTAGASTLPCFLTENLPFPINREQRFSYRNKTTAGASTLPCFFTKNLPTRLHTAAFQLSG